MDFVTVWERIKEKTDIKNISQLSVIIGKTQPTVSAKQKQKKEFPIEWAYLVAEKYNLSLNWILKGEEPIKAENEKNPKNRYILLLDEWLNEIANADPRKEYWFQCSIERTFPEFKEWVQQKKTTDQRRRITESVA